jgi:hypothetical protein
LTAIVFYPTAIAVRVRAIAFSLTVIAFVLAAIAFLLIAIAVFLNAITVDMIAIAFYLTAIAVLTTWFIMSFMRAAVKRIQAGGGVSAFIPGKADGFEDWTVLSRRPCVTAMGRVSAPVFPRGFRPVFGV